MPFYTVTHSYPLSNHQQTLIAEHITETHATLFTAPKLFVNVQFKYTPQTAPPLFVGGKPRRCNYIVAHIRPSEERTREALDELCAKVAEGWREIVENASQQPDQLKSNGTTEQGSAEDEWGDVPVESGLHIVFVLPDIGAGWEEGLAIPPAGEDQAWLRKNWGVIEGKTRGEGVSKADRDAWKELVKDVEERGLLG